MADKFLTLDRLSKFKELYDNYVSTNYVAKDGAKVLTDINFTQDLLDKLNARLEGVVLDGTEQAVANNKVTLDMSAYAKKSDVTSAFTYKGSKDDYAQVVALQDADKAVGDVWNVKNADVQNKVNAGDNVVWNGTEWDNLSGVVDLSGYVEKDGSKVLSEVDFTSAYETKLKGISEGAKKVAYTATVNSGTAIGTITIDDVDNVIYAPDVTIATEQEVIDLFNP